MVYAVLMVGKRVLVIKSIEDPFASFDWVKRALEGSYAVFAVTNLGDRDILTEVRKRSSSFTSKVCFPHAK